MSRTPRGRVLLVTPLTFGYHESIGQALASLGYESVWWNDRAGSGTAYKLALRIFPGITRRWTAASFLARLDAARGTTFTHVIVVKAEGLAPQVIDAMRKAFADIPMGFYLWDGVDNVKGVERITHVFDSVSTFDPVDAQRHDWKQRPLFSRNTGHEAAAGEPASFDWSFIGTLHSDRHRVLHRLRNGKARGMRSFVFCFSPSRLLLFVRRLTDWTLWSAPSGTLSTRAMSAAEVAAITRRSRAVLDVEHVRQRGMTMRTIETLLAGRKLVTTNRHVLDSDLYDPTRVHIIDRADPEIPPEFLELPFRPVPDEVRERYTCEGWIRELLTDAEAGFRLRHTERA